MAIDIPASQPVNKAFEGAFFSLGANPTLDWKPVTAEGRWNAALNFGELYFDLSESMEKDQLVIVRQAGEEKTSVFRVTVHPEPHFDAYRVSSD